MKVLRKNPFIMLLLVLASPLLAWGQTPAGFSERDSSLSPILRDSFRKVQSIDRHRYRSVQPSISKKSTAYRIQIPKQRRPELPVLVFFSAALGVLIFMSLFTVAQFILNREAPYGWYTAYLTTTSIWLWQSTNAWFTSDPTFTDSKLLLAFIQLSGFGMLITYIRFVSHLLEVPKQPRLERRTRYFLQFAGLSALLLLAELFFWNSVFVYSLVYLLNYCGLILLMTIMLRKQHPLKRYALVGSLLLVLGALSATFLSYTQAEATGELNQMPLFYLVVCQLLDILCFSLALGRRFQLNRDEKIQIQQQLIQQLEENQLLQQTHTLELEHQLTQREAEVLAKAHQLEEQRVSQLRSDFERRVAEAEMAGLRSQMNPHFIFNCLNSIKLYATENDSEKASEYLTKFSRLIRMVLENSRSEQVTLRHELDMLRLYTDMEIMRFKQKLSFVVDIEPGLDADFVEIPPLLLQPYVENAIWHGLMHKPEGGTVRVRAGQPQENMLQLTITDDGVGRARAAELKSKSASHRKSFGMKMTSERIALVNQLFQTQTQVVIQDLVDSDGQSTGTEVTIQIPL